MKNRPVSIQGYSRDIRALEKHIGRQIRKRRLEIGLTQQDLSSRLGLSYQQIQKYETGLNRISAGRLVTVARILGTTLDYFVSNGDDHLPPKKSKTPALLNLGNQSVNPEVKVALANLVSALNKSK